jgi:hypothetical protein
MRKTTGLMALAQLQHAGADLMVECLRETGDLRSNENYAVSMVRSALIDHGVTRQRQNQISAIRNQWSAISIQQSRS